MIASDAVYLWIGWSAIALAVVLCAYGVRELRRWRDQGKVDTPEAARARRRLREAMDAEAAERAEREKRDYL